MKFLLVLAALAALAIAAPPPKVKSEDVVITRYESDNIGVDGYKFISETSDGQTREETGELKTIGEGKEAAPAVVVRGSYSYYGDDGQLYKVEFVADENGFQPQGAHIPKP